MASRGVVNVLISCSTTSFTSEKRFNTDITIAALKLKLELITGAAANDVQLELYRNDNTLVCSMDNDSALLGSYRIDDGMRIHVIDKRGKSMEFEDVSKVEKYVLSDEDYAKKKDSVRAFKAHNKLGQFHDMSPADKQKQEEQKRHLEEKLAAVQVGQRCEVTVAGQPVKRGIIRYVGTTNFKPGQWVGVQFDEPLGKHDGSVEGKRYFECPDKYGAFVRPNQVAVGDFPELGLDDEL